MPLFPKQEISSSNLDRCSSIVESKIYQSVELIAMRKYVSAFMWTSSQEMFSGSIPSETPLGLH